jgi:hypothetical protein
MGFSPRADGWKVYAVYYLNTRTEIWAPDARTALRFVGLRFGIAKGHEGKACRAFELTTA